MFVVNAPLLGALLCQSLEEARRTIINYAIRSTDELALRDVSVFDNMQGRTRAAVELLVPIS
jgi:hypothetical protein